MPELGITVVVLFVLPSLYLLTEFLPADCWLNRALAALSDTSGDDDDDGAGVIAGPG